eukprot:3750753-Alexandrium_andersonii.AAC.1
MRSKLELRSPRNDHGIARRSSGGVRSAPLFAQIPNLPMRRAGRRAGGASRGFEGAEPPAAPEGTTTKG